MKLHPDKLSQDTSIKIKNPEDKEIIYYINKVYRILMDDLQRGYYIVNLIVKTERDNY